ncbi:MAG: AmmeMemoRadiSam system radical SAM enzyme, partial [Pseudomonadota bacterium]|nr:AmmeMemoRadiSam system radical SAM enzyme [Pseudomonadota bacterium]
VRHETDVWMEITTLLIPDENDADREIHRQSAWLAENLGVDVPLHFSAFHPDWKMLDRSATSPSTLIRARKIAMEHGLKYVYVGNIHNHEHSSTYCHSCGSLLIGRDWYELSEWCLDEEGKCEFCGAECAGHFEAKPGTWGRKRRPIRI